MELLLEPDRILYDPEGLPYVLERRGQMTRQIAGEREEIAFLTKQMELAEAKRQRSFTRAGEGARWTKRGSGGR